MAGVLQHLRSSTLNKRPNPASMVDGQIAINYASGSPGAFFKDTNGNLVKVGPVHVGATAPNVSPASGGTAGNSVGEQWLDTSGGTYVFKIWDGAAWRSEAGEFVNSTGDTMTGSLTMGPSADLIFEGSVDDGFETTLTVVNPTADRTITLPNISGTVVTTGDSETVTSAMIRDDTIVNADINSSAAIAGTKISPNFGSQTVQTTGVFSAALGTAGAPTLTFTGDLNTGLYSPGADQVAISTGGTGRLFVDATGGVQIDKTGAGGAKITSTVQSTVYFTNAANTGGYIIGRSIGSDNAHNLFSYDATNSHYVDYFEGGSSGYRSFYTNGTERLRITSDGKVGIGTSSPSSGLHVYGNSTSGYIISQGTTANQWLTLGGNFGDPVIGYPSAGSLRFGTTTDNVFGGFTERLRITSGGNVGIGTSSPGRRLVIAGDTNTVCAVQGANNGTSSVFLGDTDDESIGAFTYNHVSNHLEVKVNGSERVRITSGGNVGIGTSSPDTNLHILAPASNYAYARIEGGSGGYGGFLDLKSNTVGGSSDSAGGIRYFMGSTNQIAGITSKRTASGNDYGTLEFSTAQGAGTLATRMYISPTGSVGIGTTSPGAVLHLAGNADQRFTNTTNTSGFDIGLLAGTGSADSYVFNRANAAIILGTNNSERARIDSSGRLLVGTSTSASAGGGTNIQQIFSSTNDRPLGVHFGGASATGPYITLSKSRNTGYGSYTIVNNGDVLGGLIFAGDDGTDYQTVGAYIEAYVDGTPGANDLPTRRVFSTTADGASSPTERMRITSGGYTKITNDATYANATSTYHELRQTANDITCLTSASDANYSNVVDYVAVTRAANSAYTFYAAHSSGSGDREFTLRGDGEAYADGAWNGGGADYAEYFEWSDSNLDAEDRRGISVVLDGDKIREAQIGEDPIGVISGNPSVVGDAAWNKWSGKYLRDEFGTYMLDENGDRQLNPAYDPDVEYIPREQRPEWDCVGLMGKLRIRKGQVTGSRWIKMRDISATVEEWLVR